ncbi:MAG: uracil-DNA glycosylase family protein [Pseudomonadota bacterium]
MDVHSLIPDIQACRLCGDRFRATETAHNPRPVVWFEKGARILVAGQAPGMRVHQSGRPFTDPSGDRLREWMGIDEATFYDKNQVAIVPMAFCFPGYTPKGSDLPPPSICAKIWRAPVMQQLSDIRLTLLIGGYAQKWHLGEIAKAGVTATVAAWRDVLPNVIPLPHPSWRNNAWLKKNPWFSTDLLPVLRARVAEELA